MDKNKNLVDDYYSSIWNTSGSSPSDDWKKKIKLKSKRTVEEEVKVEKVEIQAEEEKPKQKKIIKKVIQKSIPEAVVEQEVLMEKTQEDEEHTIGVVSEEKKEAPVVKFQSSFKLVEKKDIPVKTGQISSAEFRKKPPTTGGGQTSSWFRGKIPIKGKKDFSDAQDGAKKSKLSPFKQKHKKIDIYGEEDDSFTRSHKVNKKKEEKKIEDIKQNLTSRQGQTVIVPEVLTLKELSEKIGITLPQLIAEFMKNGMMLTLNSKIDFESASIIAEVFSITLERDKSTGLSVSELFGWNVQDLLKEDDASKLQPRAPVVSIMGHVDHGKTSLLDYIRKSKVVSGEAGGITQSIGAYQAEYKERKITFLDTPGHEAFTIMRARGAKSTDIAILVVAADEGAKPQTIESINHAKEAGVSVIVAINKMDKEGANPEMVKSQLSEHGLIPEDWGWDTPMIPVSARTWFWVNELLEVILLIAEMKNLKANPNRAGIATVIESHLDTKLWPVATVLINTGKIELWDNVVCKDAFGKIKVLRDHLNTSIKFAWPGDPILVIGLDKVVEWGDILQVVSTIETAREKALEFKDILSQNKKISASSLDIIMSKIKSGNLKQLKIVVKADTNWSLEAIKGALLKLSTEETQVGIIHYGVGNITESDVLMCQWSEAILIGFRVALISNVRRIIEEARVEFISSEVIYHIIDRVEKMILWMLDPKEVTTELGRATVWGMFYSSKEFSVVGLKIKDSSIVEKKAKVRVIRDERIIGNGIVESLKEWVEEVNKYQGPGECWIKFVWNLIPQMGDTIELYKIEILR